MSHEVHAVLARDVGAPVTPAGQCTNVAPIAPEAAGLPGSGSMAGYGATAHTGGVGRGGSVAVIGRGGVGTAAIAGVPATGASRVISVDVDERKLEWAGRFGATHSVGSSRTDAVQALRDLTSGFGADGVADAVGQPETYRQAFHACDPGGTVDLVGVPGPEAEVQLPLFEIFGRGRAVTSSWYGDRLPSRGFPAFVGLYRQRRLAPAAFVTEKSPDALPSGSIRSCP